MGLAPITVPFPEATTAFVERVRPLAGAQLLLKADAFYLVTASLAGFAANAIGTRVSGIGFGEAHELALIAGLLLWQPAARRCWHLSAAGVHALLATANLAHWEALAADGMATIGVATTAVHALFVALQLAAARRAARG